ncbi:hypothetical protein Ac2012v2_001400 [Leucoagaricus gongylophorus]
MPSLTLTTNVLVQDTKMFTLKFSEFAAQCLGKPEAYITVQYDYNDTITFGGSHQPAFTLTVVSLDNLTHAQNEVYSSKFSEWLKSELNLESNRGYIVFQDPGRSHIGYQGTTFESILNK